MMDLSACTYRSSSKAFLATRKLCSASLREISSWTETSSCCCAGFERSDPNSGLLAAWGAAAGTESFPALPRANGEERANLSDGRREPEKLLSATQAADMLLDVMDSLEESDAGSFFDYARQPIPW